MRHSLLLLVLVAVLLGSAHGVKRQRVTAALVQEEATVESKATKTDVDVYQLDTTTSPLAGDLYNITLMLKGPAGGKRVRSRATRRIIEERMGFELVPRGRGDTGRRGYANVNPKHIHSGDVFGVFDLGECDPLWMYATGSRLSRVAMALRYPNNTLYIVDAKYSLRNYALGTLNPKSPAIRKTEYNEWLKEVDTEELGGLVWLPMAHELREIWDNKAAIRYFESVEGSPFGYESMAFAWLDTLRSNYGPPLSAPALSAGAEVLFQTAPAVAKDVFMQGMYNRLGLPSGTSFDGVLKASASKGYSLAQVATLPELDSYRYTTGMPPSDLADYAVDMKSWKSAMQSAKKKLDKADFPHRSLTDASLVIEMFRASKVLGEMGDKIQASEFHARDVYQLGVYQKNWHRPEGCLMDNFPYCQIGGKFAMVLSGYNSVPPYEDMNFSCPGMPPTYSRPDGC